MDMTSSTNDTAGAAATMHVGLGIAVELNGQRVATIGLDGIELMNVSMWGRLDLAEKALLDAFGGTYGNGGGGHRIWIEAQGLVPGDVVRVRLTTGGEPGDRGKTIAELHPDEAPCTRTDFTIDDAMAAELRARPRLHDAFEVRVDTACGQQASASSDERNTDFAFSVVWDHGRPDHARLNLSTYCLDDVLGRTGGTTWLQTTLPFGGDATFTLVR